MDAQQFTNDKAVAEHIKTLKGAVQKQKLIFSDVLDDEGNQYVDIVMEGGGVLGIALVGFTYCLNKPGYDLSG